MQIRNNNPFHRDEGKIMDECKRLYDLAFEYTTSLNAKDLITAKMRPRVQKLLDAVVFEIEKPDRTVGRVESAAFRVCDNIGMWTHPEDADHGARWWRSQR